MSTNGSKLRWEEDGERDPNKEEGGREVESKRTSDAGRWRSGKRQVGRARPEARANAEGKRYAPPLTCSSVAGFWNRKPGPFRRRYPGKRCAGRAREASGGEASRWEEGGTKGTKGRHGPIARVGSACWSVGRRSIEMTSKWEECAPRSSSHRHQALLDRRG